MTVHLVRQPFRGRAGIDLRTAVTLLVAFGVVRVALVLQANVNGSYQVVSLVFIAMAVLPWVLLTRYGRRAIGITRPARWWWMPVAPLAGAAASLTAFTVATAVWGGTPSNPFAYIASTYAAVPNPLTGHDRVVYFVIFAVIGITVSPVGEELLYRGLAHDGLATRLGEARAALIEAGAFALVHLAHFGIVYLEGTWMLLPLPAAFWLFAMFGSALLFLAWRRLTGSLWGAVLSHAGFNVGMNAAIFFALPGFP